MGSARKALAILTMAMVGGGAALVPALPAAASSAGCTFTMQSLKARDLHNSPTDYVWLRLNGDFFPSGNDGVSFGLNVAHTPAAFDLAPMGFLSSGLEVKVVLDTWPGNTTVDTQTIACSPDSDTITFSGHGAIYDLTYTVTK